MKKQSKYQIAKFALELPVYHLFDYLIEASDEEAQAGQRYLLPFISRFKVGLLIEKNTTSKIDPEKLRFVTKKLDQQPQLSSHLQQLAAWMAEYYLQAIGEVYFQCLPRLLRKKSSKLPDNRIKIWQVKEINQPDRLKLRNKSLKQHEVLQIIEQSPTGLSQEVIRKIFPACQTQIKALEKKQLIKEIIIDRFDVTNVKPDLYQLQDEQQQVYQNISKTDGQFCVHILQGITGSGKTEVYFHLIKDQIRQNKQVIYLVPEIGLTPQLIKRTSRAFGDLALISHSGLSDIQRYKAWDQFRLGLKPVLLGTRSSVFSETKNLGLIIIDEEHDSSFRQQDGIRYHARDVAIKRAQLLKIPILLGTATPSLESLNNVNKLHYRLHHLNQRQGGGQTPIIQILDISKSYLQAGLAAELIEQIRQQLKQGNQVLIYLNRRGFAPVVHCHECGWMASCQQCDAKMTLHQSVNQLICHHCGSRSQLFARCPSCNSGDIKHYGIGTEQLELSLSELFEGVDIIRIDRDTIKNKNDFETRLQQIQSGKAAIIIGTQMIAKGHDYANITLVAVLESDQALYSGQYRASERLAQTILQVSGRAGRANKVGKAIVQTRFADHPLMLSITTQDYSDIAQQILLERKQFAFPPYSRVVIFRADATELEKAINKLDEIKKVLQQINSGDRTNGNSGKISILGPVPAIMSKRIGRYRAQLSLISNDFSALRSLLKMALPEIVKLKISKQLKWQVDVDPFDL